MSRPAQAVHLVVTLLVFALAAWPGLAHEGRKRAALPSIREKTKGMEKRDGFLPLYWDVRTGTLWLEIARLGEELLYYSSLPTGIGSNDIGLDRGQLGPRQLVRFERVGTKILLVQPNFGYRAESDNPAERRAVEEAFAVSVLHGFEVAAQTGETVLVDATGFVLRDAHDVVGTLRRSGQGAFALDPTRSALHLARTRGFPDNTEIEATLTFALQDGEPGAWLRSVAPAPGSVTVRQHHSFVRLAPSEYRARRNDPRSGFFGIRYLDYAAPLGEPIERRFIVRHRLSKRDPEAETSEAVEPIVYYLDPGAPEPVRSALLDGARWWTEAFEAAGYRDAFRVEMLPDGADPMDVRYNVIQWVHRATRGWSYGDAVIDPRTGEILNGHVSLGSLRARQDYLIAEGLLAPYEQGDERPAALAETALARIRQLSAHEVGHTLGLAHNYVASAQGAAGRASVMDYPHPLARLRPDGTIDLSAAYDTGVGEWDRVAIAYGYQDFPAGTDEDVALAKIVEGARANGLTFLSDKDARPRGGAHPQAHLWDNAVDPAAELERVMDVRRAALERFGEGAIRGGRPLATLEEVLVPLYLHHRYQTEAAVKLVGGIDYVYAMRGDGQEPLRPVAREDQERALEAVLRTLRPEELAIPDRVLERLPPRPAQVDSHRELFPRYTGPAFDPVAPAEAAADLSVSLLLEPERAARLVTQHALDPRLPGLDEVLARLVDATFDSDAPSGYEAEIAGAVQWVVVQRLQELAGGAPMPRARAIAELRLRALRDKVDSLATGPAVEAGWYRYLATEIGRFLDRRMPADPRPALPEAPPGSPIGMDSAGAPSTQ
jgi:hypothetical protein